MMQADENNAKLGNSDTSSECKNKESFEKEHEATTNSSENPACDKDMMQREENQTNIDNTTTSHVETNKPTSDKTENNESAKNLSENTSNNEKTETENNEEKCTENITFQERSSGEQCEKVEEIASGPIAESKATNQQSCSNSNRNRTDVKKDNTNADTSKKNKDPHNDPNFSKKDKKGKGNMRENRFGNNNEKAKEKVDSKHQANADCDNQFVFFWKSYSPYSQWYLRDFTVGGQEFNCAEQYMMYGKAMLFNDDETADEILKEKEPRNHKSLGRRVKNFDQKKWDKNCLDIVKQGNKAKFSQNEDLYNIIIDSHPKTLVEASPMDKIWGIGLASSDFRARDRNKWRGKNLLGQALTEVRDELRRENSRKKEISTTGKGSMACSTPETREGTKEDITNVDTTKENTTELSTDVSGTAENSIEIGTTENSIEIGTTENNIEMDATENIGTTEDSIEISTAENIIEMVTTEDKPCTVVATEGTTENNANDSAINESSPGNKTDDIKEVTPEKKTDKDSTDEKSTEAVTNDTKEYDAAPVTSRKDRRLVTEIY